MPINYKNYPPNWKTEIIPAIKERSGDKCEFCGVRNNDDILRGMLYGVDVYQRSEDYGIYDGQTSKFLHKDYLGEIESTSNFIRVVLTVAHLDHDTSNNDLLNLRHLCQRCHNRHDIQHRVQSRKKNKLKNQLSLF